MLEKGKQPGSHQLSGAVVNPRGLRRLFRGEKRAEDMPFYGEVDAEGVYFLRHNSAMRIPTPPTMKNHGNYVASISQLTRWLAEQAEEAGATILPETVAEKLLVKDGRVVGVRTGDKGRGRNGEKLPNFEPGSDILARVTILCEGTQGHLTGIAIDEFGLQGESPQVWALGVKEVWKVAKPLRRVVHTMGWPLRARAKYREFGGSFIYPMGDDMLTIGMVVGLDYRDASLSVHDLLQELKTNPFVRKMLAGGERIAWGAKTIPEGGLVALPSKLHAPGLLLCGDGAGMVNVPALKGIHYAVESGRLAAEAASRRCGRGDALDAGRPRCLRRGRPRELHLVRSERGAEHAPGVRTRLLLRRRTRRRDDREQGALSAARPPDRARRRPVDLRHGSGARLSRARRKAHVRQALERLPVRKPQPRRRAEPPAGADGRPSRARAAVGADVPGTGLRSRRRGIVEVTPSNCVQCGAITAKGGRLTPPEGGSGPEYTIT